MIDEALISSLVFIFSLLGIFHLSKLDEYLRNNFFFSDEQSYCSFIPKKSVKPFSQARFSNWLVKTTSNQRSGWKDPNLFYTQQPCASKRISAAVVIVPVNYFFFNKELLSSENKCIIPNSINYTSNLTWRVIFCREGAVV